jgi:hypothetical protein
MTKSKNISTKGPRNCRSLGFAPPDFLWNLVALTNPMRLSLRERRTRDPVQGSVTGNPGRDDKGEGDLLWKLVPEPKNASIPQPICIKLLPFPLSSRAKPRDLRFRGPFVEMFFDRVVMGLRPTQSDEKRLGPAANLYQTVALSFVIPSGRLAESESGVKRQSLYPLQHRRVKSKGAPGLAFETWDPSSQFPLETPTLLFVIPSEAEGSAVPRTFPGNVFRPSVHV